MCNRFIFIVALAVVCIGVVSVSPAAAQTQSVEFFFKTSQAQLGVGESLEVEVWAKNLRRINALGGVVRFPTELAAAQNVRTGDSIVNFWVDGPRLDGDAVIFAGIIPNGFAGEEGKLFSAVFEGASAGEAVLSFENLEAFLNDGQGTAMPVSGAPLTLAVTLQPQGAAVSALADTIPPQSFELSVACAQEVYEGKCFVVFATQDKESGVDHYEIRERRLHGLGVLKIGVGKWYRAQSPQLLRDQQLKSRVEVRAIDAAGNKRAVFIEPMRALAWYEDIGAWLLITLGIVLFVVVVVSRIRRKIVRIGTPRSDR